MGCILEGVKVEVANHTSILNSMNIIGLSLYRFGEMVIIPFFTEKWRIYSFYYKICINYKKDLYTLVLLDIKVKAISEENLAQGKKIYEKPRFMTVNQALEELIQASEKSDVVS